MCNRISIEDNSMSNRTWIGDYKKLTTCVNV